MKTLRIVFCVLSCVCVAACVPAGVWLGWLWVIGFIALAALFAAGMYFCKSKSEETPNRKPDFTDEPAKPEEKDDSEPKP